MSPLCFITPDPKGYAEGPNLYQYSYNNPYRFTDHFGEAAYPISFPPLPYLHPEAATTVATEVLTNSRVQGGVQAFTGLAEVGAGVTMTYATGGLALPLGWLAIAHGFDHFITGMNQAFNGAPIDTTTSTLLQHAGMSRDWANCVDYSASFGLIAKGAAVARAVQLGGEFLYARSSFSSHNLLNQDIALGYGAENVNSGVYLRSKLSGLQKAQGSAFKIRKLPDSRVRYYSLEIPASKPGLTRGASYVTEWKPSSGQVRSWMESYDHLGQVTRVHPKMLNGQTLNSVHYPPISRELGVK